MFNLSSEVNGTAFSLDLTNISQFEHMLAGHLSAAILAIATDNQSEAPLDALRVDVKLTRPSTDQQPGDSWIGPMVNSLTIEGSIERIMTDSWVVDTVIMSARDPQNETEVYYLLVTRSRAGEWSLSDHVIIQTEKPGESEESPDAGHFLELTPLEQLRHFATS